MKLAICGKMCSGKSTLAHSIRRMDKRYTIYSFGSKVKEVASDLFHMDPSNKDRTLLTSIGSKMREIDPDVWIKYVVQQIPTNKEHCIIDDLRYQNEYEYLAKRGWTFIQLTVPRDEQIKRIKQRYPHNYEDHLKADSHESEVNSFQWLKDKYPALVIHSTDSEVKIYQQVFSFIQKNEYSKVYK